MFHKTAFSTHRSLNLEVNKSPTINMKIKAKCHILNSLPNKIKKETEYVKFKEFINDCFAMKCKWNLCSC